MHENQLSIKIQKPCFLGGLARVISNLSTIENIFDILLACILQKKSTIIENTYRFFNYYIKNVFDNSKNLVAFWITFWRHLNDLTKQRCFIKMFPTCKEENITERKFHESRLNLFANFKQKVAEIWKSKCHGNLKLRTTGREE